MAEMNIYPVIMAGGSGTRLWPLSTLHHPKQFHAFMDGNSLLQNTVLRVRGEAFLPPLIICQQSHVQIVQTQIQAVDVRDAIIIAEPLGRNTAPCAVIAALCAEQAGLESMILLLPADHHIEDVTAFHSAVQSAWHLAQAGYVVSLGINPTEPATGYGYIAQGLAVPPHGFKVQAFIEKPDLKTAQDYLHQGGYLWNGGMFMFAPHILLEEMQTYAPDIVAQARVAFAHIIQSDGIRRLPEDAYSQCRSESIDYALMERTDKAAVVPVDMGWSDIGAFDKLHELLKAEDDNALYGDVWVEDVQNCLIRTDGPFVVACGVDDLLIVVQGGQILVTRRDEAQNVKKIVARLKTQNRTIGL